MTRTFRAVAVLLVLLMMSLLPVAAFADGTPVDTTKLEELLYIADSAKRSNYTSESWEALAAAIEQAKAAINGGDQAAVDAARKELATALSKVTSMNYSSVEEAMSQVDRFLQENEMGNHWDALQKAIAKAQSLYGSGDQAGVERAAEEILQRLEELEDYITAHEGSSVVWIVLFFVSLAGNLAVVAVLVLKRRSSKKTQVDDVPLVDYDIDDDIA